MKSKMELKLVKIMAPIFEVEESVISEDASPENIETWDSLAHMSLVLALEEEFGIQFTEDQIVESFSFKALVDILNNI